LKQSQVDDHFTVIPEEEKPTPYTDELFKEAAIQWLIETDQVPFYCLVMPTARPGAMGRQGGSLFWADRAAYQPPALSRPGPAKPYPKLHKSQS